MSSSVNRRRFVRETSATAAGFALAGLALPAASRGDIQFGYAAITWQGQDRQAIEDVAAKQFLESLDIF
ncbi:MAG: hypothetical protein ACRD2N_24925 [Vicinamibacterales bacterium]